MTDVDDVFVLLTILHHILFDRLPNYGGNGLVECAGMICSTDVIELLLIEAIQENDLLTLVRLFVDIHDAIL